MSDPQRKAPVGPLRTVGELVGEMGRVYRLARREEMDIKRASRLVYILSQMRSALEVSALEERIAALEGGR